MSKFSNLDSKETLLKHIEELEANIEKVFNVGMEGIGYVGASNDAYREQEARAKLFSVYYQEEVTAEQAEDMF